MFDLVAQVLSSLDWAGCESGQAPERAAARLTAPGEIAAGAEFGALNSVSQDGGLWNIDFWQLTRG